MNEYLLETLARDRLAEARAVAARTALIQRLHAGRTSYSVGVALVRLGIRLLSRVPEPRAGAYDHVLIRETRG